MRDNQLISDLIVIALDSVFIFLRVLVVLIVLAISIPLVLIFFPVVLLGHHLGKFISRARR